MLTEGHVPQPQTSVYSQKKVHLARVFYSPRSSAKLRNKFKHHGNWYGNRLALTICVNTKTPSLPHKSGASCKCRWCCLHRST